MIADPHQEFQTLIDELVVGGASRPDILLEEHLRTCPQCAEYFQVNMRVVAALGQFTFGVDPALQKKVLHAARLGSRPAWYQTLDRRQLTQVCFFAFALFLGGSFLDMGVGRLIEPLFQTWHVHLRRDLLNFWVLPSFLIVLAFPLLPLLAQHEERIA